MKDTYILVEEEAALINYYKNSRKIKKETNQAPINAEVMMNNLKKTMKELILESIAHVERQKI